MANGHGGRRAGSGRKTKAEKFAGPINRSEKQLADALPQITSTLLELAFGTRVRVVTREGVEEVRDRLPDLKALIFCYERIAGREAPVIIPPPPPPKDPSGDDYTLHLGPEVSDENDPSAGGNPTPA